MRHDRFLRCIMRGYVAHVRRILWIALALNALVAVGKLAVGYRADSLSVIGDGLHSSVDAAANVVALIVLHLATRPADEDHPFGHAKYETLAAFAVAGLMLVTAVELAQLAVSRLVSPVATRVTALTVGVMVATLVVNVLVSRFEMRAGRERGSDLLVADAAQTRGDVYVTLGVLAGFWLQAVGVPRVDGAIALAVAFVILHSAWVVLREALPVLTDRIVHDPADVARIVQEVPGVVNVHDIRSRGHPREAFVQMHLVVDADDVVGAHEITDAVEDRLARELGVKEVFIHVEPEDDQSGPPGTNGERAGASTS